MPRLVLMLNSDVSVVCRNHINISFDIVQYLGDWAKIPVYHCIVLTFYNKEPSKQ